MDGDEELATTVDEDEVAWDCGGARDDVIAGPTELVGPKGGFNFG